ncbi:MOS1T transposase, partial [Pseudoatta argentina]
MSIFVPNKVYLRGILLHYFIKHRIVTGDEKWIHYDNPKRRKSWGKPGHASRKTAAAVSVSYGIAFNILNNNLGIKNCRPDECRDCSRRTTSRCSYQFQISAKLVELRYKLLLHPPYSPDLAPYDFFLFPNLKKWLGGKKFTSNEEVIAETEAYFAEFDKSYFLEGLRTWQKHWSAERLLTAIERRCGREVRFGLLYHAFLKEYEEMHHMEAVPRSSESQARCYLPHHGVLRELNSSTKLRVVFNGSQSTRSGKSLNSQLLVGANLLPSLADVLTRWRVTDIEKMYRQILVAPEDRDYQRILWRHSLNDPVREYRLNMVTYGLSYAPFRAIRTLRQLVDDENARFPRGSAILRHDCYVDDIVTGAAARSLPQLELCAAALLTKLTRTVLSLSTAPVTLWSYSKVTLYWIQGHASQWKTYVANRVSIIQEVLPERRWRHVPGRDNPADCVSRGITPGELTDHPLWWSGPPWLLRDSTWPNAQPETPSEEMLEQRIHSRTITSKVVTEPELILRFSSLHRLLRVTADLGGRLKHVILSPDERHPIIVPPHSHLARLLISSCHRQSLYGGVQLTLGLLRLRYWRGHASSRGCEHLSHKAFIAIFVCLCSKATHLEVVSDYTTDAFLAALRRFTSRRGLCSDIYSDCGMNFIGADRQIRELFRTSIANAAVTEGIRWHFNPPSAPHFGGLWKAVVKSTKYHLRKVIGDATLTYEEMSTLLTQVEACLNSRSLLALFDDPDDLSALTPGHLPIGAPLLAIPEPSLAEKATSSLSLSLSLSRWKHLQAMHDHFWER